MSISRVTENSFLLYILTSHISNHHLGHCETLTSQVTVTSPKLKLLIRTRYLCTDVAWNSDLRDSDSSGKHSEYQHTSHSDSKVVTVTPDGAALSNNLH